MFLGFTDNAVGDDVSNMDPRRPTIVTGYQIFESGLQMLVAFLIDRISVLCHTVLRQKGVGGRGLATFADEVNDRNSPAVVLGRFI